MASISSDKEIVEAVVFLVEARITGEVLHVDGGAFEPCAADMALPAAEQRLKQLGIVLPSPPIPLGAYVEAVRSDHWSLGGIPGRIRSRGLSGGG
jgi:hypothetical protein